MKLLVTVISKSDAPATVCAMSKEGYPATVVSSIGGFLGLENTVILSGIDDKKVNTVIKIIKDNTSESIVDVPADRPCGNFKLPPQVKIGSAVIFVCNIEQYIRL